MHQYQNFFTTGRILLPLLCLFFSFSIPAQELSVTDSLRNELQKATADSTRAILLMLIANRLPTSDSTEAREYFRRALHLTDRDRQPELTAKIYANTGRLYYNLYRFEDAQDYMDSAQNVLKADTSLAAKKLRAHIQLNVAALYGVNGYLRKQQEQYLELIPLFTKLGDTANLALSYRNLGVIFFNKKQYPRALEYYKKALETYDESDKNRYYFGTRQLDMAMCLSEMDSLQAMEYYLREAENIMESNRDTVDQMAQLYYLKGELAFKKERHNEAEGLYHTSYEIAKDFNNVHYMANSLIALSDLYDKQERYGEALTAAREYYDIGADLKDFHFQLLGLEMLGDLEFKLKNYPESYRHLKEHIQVSDSLNEVELTKTMHQLDKQFETSRKEQQIAQLQYEKDTAELKLVRNQLGIWLLLITVFALLMLSFLYFLYYRKGKKLIQQQKRVHQLEMDALLQEHKISLLSATINGEEQERSRIAKDLHDGLGGLLSGVKLSLSNALKEIRENPARETISDAVGHIDEAVDELRTIAQSLMPQALNLRGLGQAIKQFCDKVCQPGVNITCQVINVADNTIPKDRQITLYRIVQELVNNALKHSGASHILVQLQQREGKLYLTVEDNGKGFNPATSGTNGLGMSNLNARVELLKGEMEINSGPGTGTSVCLQCQVKAPARV